MRCLELGAEEQGRAGALEEERGREEKVRPVLIGVGGWAELEAPAVA